MTRPTDSWTDRLSEYVDGDLDAGTRAALDAHLATCPDCRATREELERVVVRARRIGYREPRHALWARVGAGITARGSEAARPIRRRVITLSLARLAAAAGIVAAVVGGTTWAIATRRGAPAPTVVRATDSAGVGTPGEGGSLTLGAPALAVASYRDAAADLERTFDAGRATLRPETMRIIEENLRTIDGAIAQADSALRRDPGSAYLNQYLAETMQRKLKLLRRAVEITSARS
jgi:anti-sigma factor RsiW